MDKWKEMKDQAQCYEEKVETKSHCAQTKVYTTITTNEVWTSGQSHKKAKMIAVTAALV